MTEPSKTHAPSGLRRRGTVCFVAAARRCAPTSPAPPRLAYGPPALATRPFVLSPRTAKPRADGESLPARSGDSVSGPGAGGSTLRRLQGRRLLLALRRLHGRH